MNPASATTRRRTLSTSQIPSSATLVTPRPVVFELHIRRMFRSLDREHMSFAFNLWQYNDAPTPEKKNFYLAILNHLKAADPGNVMPPPNEGGPWPPEWIALFERWINEGLKQLDKATAIPAQLQAVRDPGTLNVTITASGNAPSSGHVVWIERAYDPARMYADDLPDVFVLYQEQRTASPPTPAPFNVQDTFEVPAANTQLTVVDAAGSHMVNIT